MATEAPPEWLVTRYPSLVDATMHLARVVRSAASTPHAEVELRLGHPGTPWRSDCTFEVIDRFLTRCSDGGRSDALQFDGWREHVDYFHTDSAGAGLRSRVTFDSDDCTVHTHTVRKERVERATAHVDQSDWDVRMDACIEHPVDATTLPDLVSPTRVCIAHRCSALSSSARSPQTGPIWRYDVTMRWEAATRTQAEALQRGGQAAPVHTVELEYVGGIQGVESLGAVYIACSGLLKLLDVIGASPSSGLALSAPGGA